MNQTLYSAKNMDEMHACGEKIAGHISLPSVVYLQGDLGAGKTTLVQGIARYFSYTEIVSSPSYNIVHQYPTETVSISHLDLYRLNDPEELEMLGLADLLDESSLLLIEWPEKGEERLPAADLLIDISYQSAPNTGRDIQISCV